MICPIIFLTFLIFQKSNAKINEALPLQPITVGMHLAEDSGVAISPKFEVQSLNNSNRFSLFC